MAAHTVPFLNLKFVSGAVVTLLISLAPSVPWASCGLFPPHQERKGFQGHETWQDEDLRVFVSDGYSFPALAEWEAIGAKQGDDGCLTAPAKQTVAVVRSSAWQSRDVTVSPTAKMPVRLLSPATWTPAQTDTALERIATVFERIADLYPLGLDPAGTEPFAIIATVDGRSRSDVHPVDTPQVGFLSALPDTPAFDAQVARMWVQLFSHGRPHPELGPKERRKPSLSAKFPLEVFDALVAGYASLAAAYELQDRDAALYRALLNYFAIVDDNYAASPVDAECRHVEAGNFAQKQTRWGFGSDQDRQLYTQCLAPAHAILLSDAFTSSEDQGSNAFRDWVRRTHENGFTPLSIPLPERLQGIAWVETLFSPSRQLFINAYRRARQMGLIELPQVDRPRNLKIYSEGAKLDARLYSKSTDARADRVFLLTHSYDPMSYSPFVRAFDLVAARTVEMLLEFGDVLVLHRAGYGETVGGTLEEYGPCANPEYLIAAQDGGVHIGDAAHWLKRRSYDHIIGVSRGVGAVAMLSAVERGDISGLLIADPVRGAATRESVCAPDRMLHTVEQLYARAKTVPLEIAGHPDLIFYEDGRQKEFEGIFGKVNWLKPRAHDDPTNGFYQNPERWRSQLEKLLKKI